MRDDRPSISFDTSGLNALADDTDADAIVKSLGVGFRVLLSETNLSEISATTVPERRERLLDMCQRLIHRGEAIRPSYWILNAMAQHHANRHKVFDWRFVEVRWRELEQEIARRTLIGIPGVAEEIRSDNRATNKEFSAIFKRARQLLTPEGSTHGISASDTIDLLTMDESPLWRLASDIYEGATRRKLAEVDAREYVSQCPPVWAILVSVCVGLYHWGLKGAVTESNIGAGALDLFMAAYLPYCSRFVTKDDGQCNALRLVAQRARLSTAILTYADFRRVLLVT